MLKGATQDRDKTRSGVWHGAVQPNRCELDRVLPAVVELLFEGSILADGLRDPVDDADVGGQDAERRGVTLAGQGDPPGTSGVIRAEDDEDVGVADRLARQPP